MAMLTICGKTYPSNNKYVIFKNSTILMMSVCNNSNTFDFFTLYTTIPRSKLKDRLKE
jgi:hypothetical protein